MEIIAITEVSHVPDEQWIITVEICPNRTVDVKMNSSNDFIYIMQNHDGSEVFDPATGITYPGFHYDGNAVIAMVRNAFPDACQTLYQDCKEILHDLLSSYGASAQKGSHYGLCCYN